jgi:hypothetical protein
MPFSVADAVAKRVLSTLIPTWTRGRFVLDVASTDVGPAVQRGQNIGLGQIDRPTLIEDGDTDTDPQAFEPSEDVLSVDRHPMYNVRIPAISDVQYLEGSWLAQTANGATNYLRSHMDERFVARDLLEGPLASTAATPPFHRNLAADALTRADVEDAMARMLAVDGVQFGDLVWLASPYALGSIRASDSYANQVQQNPDSGRLGISQVGLLAGAPLYASNAVPFDLGASTPADLNPGAYRRTLSAISSSSGTVTATVGSGHGFVQGQQVRVLGCSESALNGSGTVSSVTATTVVVDITGSGTVASATTPGVMVAASSMLLLVSRTKAFRAAPIMPTTRVVPMPNSSASSLQISALWGALAVDESAVALHAPPDSVA